MLARKRWITLLLLIFLPLAAAASEGGDSKKGAANQVNYVELKPSFVLNVGQPSAQPPFLKVDIILKVDNKADVKTVEHYEPAFRNTLVMLLSSASLDEVSSPKGQEKLRKASLSAINALLKKEEGKAMVGNLLFTTFIVQEQ